MITSVRVDCLAEDGHAQDKWSTLVNPMVGAYLEAPSRRLVDCCRSCGVELTSAHSAQADAAAAGLLAHYLRYSRYEPPWEEVIVDPQEYPWPAFTGTYPTIGMVTRQDVFDRAPDEWLGGIVSRMPRAADVRAKSYLAVLEMALLVNVLAEHEKHQLVEVAQQPGADPGRTQLLEWQGGQGEDLRPPIVTEDAFEGILERFEVSSPIQA